MDRPVCQFPACTRLGRNKGHTSSGKKKFGRFCQLHHQVRAGKEPFQNQGKVIIPNNKCEECGWDQAPCDRHKIEPSKGYRKDNIKVLCPNHHRLVHLKV